MVELYVAKYPAGCQSGMQDLSAIFFFGLILTISFFRHNIIVKGALGDGIATSPIKPLQSISSAHPLIAPFYFSYA